MLLSFLFRRVPTGLCFCSLAWMTGCLPPSTVEMDLSPVSLAPTAPRPTNEAAIRQFCGNCHAVPDPNSFVKSRWHHEVEQGFQIYRQSQRTDLTPPDFEATLAYFRDAAPDTIPIPMPERVDDSRFRAVPLDWPIDAPLSAVSSLTPTQRDGEPPAFLMTDMWTGVVATFRANPDATDQNSVPPIVANWLTRGAHVARASVSDLDGNGQPDYLVADLGTPNPQAEQEGNVWWLAGDATTAEDRADGTMKRWPLRLGLSRVAEARAIDFDGDGDQDVLVGDFGLHVTGGIHVGINQGMSAAGAPKLDWRRLDSRPGTIVIPVCDLNDDGLDDFISLVTQHYEMIEAHLNQGDGTFQAQTIHHTLDPAFGSSSMTMIDFDHDGDLDVVYTNGDTFDDTLAKPTHGIQWLENRGTFPFTPHRVGWMPGCYHADAGDFDGDGDTDVVAVALLTDGEINRYASGTLDGVAWFEQTDMGFIRHSLVTDACNAATCSVVDWNQDGRLDILVPPCDLGYGSADQFTLFLNEAEFSSDAKPVAPPAADPRDTAESQ